MSYQSIGLGSEADDGTGDALRVGGDKVNDNFVELYTLLGDATDLSSGISATATVVTLTAPTISGVVGGTQTSATITTLTSTTVNAGTIVFEGATADAYETTLTVTDPTADRTITFPNITGTVVTTGDTNTVSLAMMAGLARGKIIYGDSSGDPAALAVGSSGTFLKHDGTDVSWANTGTAYQSVITSNTTMVSGRGYFVNTTAGAITMTLPASPSIGDFVRIIDYAGTFDSNTCTVGRNSQKIAAASADMTVTTERAGLELVFTDSTQGWLLTEK